MKDEARRAFDVATLVAAGAAISCISQWLWLGPRMIRQVDFDGMAYLGIARHLHNREFQASINAFRSPLVSWLVALLSFFDSNYVTVGKAVSVGSFVLCLILVHAFTMDLWQSRLVAATAALLFTLGRGLCEAAVASVTPDFIFAAVTLSYFLLLLRCLRRGTPGAWFLLGAVHGVAFLAKAFALPWLACCTAISLLAANIHWKAKVVRLALASLLPITLAAGWAGVLHAKYGVWTTGSQFKANLLQWTLSEYAAHEKKTYILLRDTAGYVDELTVADPMPPGSWAWSYRVDIKGALPRLVEAEIRNLPLAVKELTVVVTPGCLLAFIIVAGSLTSLKGPYPVESNMVIIIVGSVIVLLLAYCMLVFDGRYLYPAEPLVIALSARFLVPHAALDHKAWRRVSLGLTILGIIATLVYGASPFRVVARDFQASSYEAGAILTHHSSGAKLVSIGTGPFPQFGVGWESGYQAAYFGRGRLVAARDTLPDSDQEGTLIADIRKANPDAILIWGSGERYLALKKTLASQFPNGSVVRVSDPVLGEVGSVQFAFTNK